MICYIFSKRQISQNPYLYNRVTLPNLNIRIFYSTYKDTQNGYVNGTQKWSQAVWNNTYPANHCIPYGDVSFSGHHFSN